MKKRLEILKSFIILVVGMLLYAPILLVLMEYTNLIGDNGSWYVPLCFAYLIVSSCAMSGTSGLKLTNWLFDGVEGTCCENKEVKHEIKISKQQLCGIVRKHFERNILKNVGSSYHVTVDFEGENVVMRYSDLEDEDVE